MKNRIIFTTLVFVGLSAIYLAASSSKPAPNEGILSYIVDPKTQNLRLFWQDDSSHVYHNFGKLKKALEQDSLKLVFGMNAGMFMEDHRPLGLYIENGTLHRKLNTTETAYGNFYLQPNGVFYITKDKSASVISTKEFTLQENIRYATQSGPMLLIDGALHPKLTEGSSNLHIRNGVGILPDGRILFAMSKTPINFFDLASYFKGMGCKNALYLDGAVCRTYLPKQNLEQLDGILGPLVGVVEQRN